MPVASHHHSSASRATASNITASNGFASDSAASDSTAESTLEPAVVWADTDGRPVRLVWQGVRWRVSDRPTLITEPVPWWSSLDPEGNALELAPLSCTGWRFQATASDGRACVFDVRDDGDTSRWLVVKVYS